MTSGRTVAQYEILDEAGSGGMGLVYRARDVRLNRIVALKFLPAALAQSESARHRFGREARAIAALNHPHIATIHELGYEGDQPFLVLEYLPGGTLKDKLEAQQATGAKFDLEQARSYAIQAAKGLGCAHAKGILHRDIKPSNLMFAADGTLKITDFGLSAISSEMHITEADTRIGTPLYMAPEQAAQGRYDARTDLYSLALVLYEMLAGEAAFAAPTNVAIMARVIHATPTPIRSVRAELPHSMATFLERALARDPARRFQTAAEFVTALERTRSAIPAETVSMESPAPSERLAPRWPVAAAIVAVFAVLLAGLLWYRLRHPPLPPRRSVAVLPFTNSGNDAADQAFCDGLEESLTSALSELEPFHGALRVVPSSEIRKLAVDNVAAARRAFGVNLVVTGSMQHSGDQVRLTANLVDARELRQIASRTFTAAPGQAASLDQSAVREIADLLSLEVGAGEQHVKQRSIAEPGAYELYLQARGSLDRFDKPGNLDRSIDLFRRVIAADPHYALAYSGLSSAYLRKYAELRDPQLLQQAQEMAQQASQLDPSLASARVNLGIVYSDTGHYEAAIAALKAALEVNPVLVDAYRALAEAYEASGNLAAAEQTLKHAIDLRPDDWLTYTLLGTFYYTHSRIRDAEAPFRKVIQLTPDNHVAYANIASVHSTLGDFEPARAEYLRAIEIKPTARSYVGLGSVDFGLRRYSEAAQMFQKAVDLTGGKSYTSLGNLAEADTQVPELAAQAPGVYRRAMEVATHALAINPKDTLALSCLGLYRAHAGELKAGLEDELRAHQMAPGDAHIVVRLATVRELAGDRNQALRDLEWALNRGYPPVDILSDPALQHLREDARFQKLIESRRLRR